MIRLKKERGQLQAALNAKIEEISDREAILSVIPLELKQHEDELSLAIAHVLSLQNTIRQVPGSLEADMQTLSEIDEIRLRAIDAITKRL